MKNALFIPCLETSGFPIFGDALDVPAAWDVVARETYGDCEICYIHPTGDPVPPREEWDSFQTFERNPWQQISIALDGAGNYLTLTLHVAPNGHQRPEPRLHQYHQVKEGETLMAATPTDWVFAEMRSFLPTEPSALWERVNLLTYTKEAALAAA